MEEKLTLEEQRRIDATKKAKKDLLKKDLLKKIGKRIKNYRKAIDYSQENLASDISKSNIIPYIDNFSDKIISRHENGSSEMGIITFINYCRTLHKTPNELLADYFKDAEVSKPEILKLYEQLSDWKKVIAIKFIQLLLSDQDIEDMITKF